LPVYIISIDERKISCWKVFSLNSNISHSERYRPSQGSLRTNTDSQSENGGQNINGAPRSLTFLLVVYFQFYLIEFKILNVASRKFTSLGIGVHPVTRNQAWVLIFHAWIVCSKPIINGSKLTCEGLRISSKLTKQKQKWRSRSTANTIIQQDLFWLENSMVVD
jgi:hypothetical protein